MLTPTSPKPLPSTSSCDAGRLVAGATVAQIAIGALQVASVKLLGEAHYHIQQQGYTAAVPYQIPAPMDKGYEEAHQLLYATTPLTEWISFEVLYSATTFMMTSQPCRFLSSRWWVAPSMERSTQALSSMIS